ncbi:MAG TPA: Lsr2 family protein [Cellulomonas sp.]
MVVQKTDDIDGSEANETVTFAVDGVTYEIDLTAGHAAELRTAVEPYTKAARRVGGVARRATVAAVKAAKNYDPKAVRAWAGSRHIEIPARGRIPAAVVEQYRAAGN